jgi:Mor family transcriptional regulator
MDECMIGAGVNLTKDDVNKVIALFAHEKAEPGSDLKHVLINYLKMSVEMGLQQPSMN